MHILILGNGFDIAHDLPTKYSDFLNYCKEQLQEKTENKSSNLFFTNLWVRHFLTIQQEMGENWIDLENEISKVIIYISRLSMMNNKDEHKIFTKYYYDNNFSFYIIDRYLDSPLGHFYPEKGYSRCQQENQIKYIVYFSSPKGVVEFLYEQLREFTKLFEEYLQEEVLKHINIESKYKLSLKSIGVKEKDKNIRVLSFNYTDTCERLYKHKFNTYCEFKIKPVYVHGKTLDCENCNLILGTKSFDLNPPRSSLPAHFNIFQKHYQRHKYQTIEPYQELIRQIKKSCSAPKFHIIGHSLDESDHKIIRHVLKANENSIINIYFHDEESQKRLMDNINTIIGEEEVMTKVRFIHQHNDERSILKPK